MFIVYEIIDNDYSDFETKIHSICESACIAAKNAKQMYEQFVKTNSFNNIALPKFEELELQSKADEMCWTYLKTSENYYFKYSAIIKPYQVNTEINISNNILENVELF